VSIVDAVFDEPAAGASKIQHSKGLFRQQQLHFSIEQPIAAVVILRSAGNKMIWGIGGDGLGAVKDKWAHEDLSLNRLSDRNTVFDEKEDELIGRKWTIHQDMRV
jgi:hypothetical protein